MKKNEMYLTKELTLAEKHLFIWLNSYQKKHKKINLTNVAIAKALGVDLSNIGKVINRLIKKGFIFRTKYRGDKCNKYEILK